MANQCAAPGNGYLQNLTHQNDYPSAPTHSSEPNGCGDSHPPVLLQNTANPSNATSLEQQHIHSKTHPDVPLQALNQNIVSSCGKEQSVSSCLLDAAHESLTNTLTLSDKQALNSSLHNASDDSGSNFILDGNCSSHVLVTNQLNSTLNHQTLVCQIVPNEGSGTNQIGPVLHDHLNLSSNQSTMTNQSIPNSHPVTNLMSPLVNHHSGNMISSVSQQQSMSSINPINQDISNSISLSFNEHSIENNVAAISLAQQNQVTNPNLIHPSISTTMNSTSAVANSNHNLSNINSNLSMNLFIPDISTNQSNLNGHSIYNSYHSNSNGSSYYQFDSNMSWLSENRNHFLVDRNFCNSRLGMLENISLCSPNSVESIMRNCKEASNFQSKSCLSTLSDPVQSWLNISSITNPPPLKYNEQVSPNLNLMCVEQPDLHRQADLANCMKFDYPNHKVPEVPTMKHLSSDIKIDDGPSKNCKESSFSPKDKSGCTSQFPSLVISNEFTDNYEFGVPSIGSLPAPCFPIDSFNCKSSYNFSTNKTNLLDCPASFIFDENELDGCKMKQTMSLQSCTKNRETLNPLAEPSVNLFSPKLNTRSDCMKTEEVLSCDEQIDLDNSCDDSNESDIIVEDSDSRSADDEHNEVTVDTVKTRLMNETMNFSTPSSNCSITLRCFICDVSTTNVPANEFIHTNCEFPVTSTSKIPIISKLLEIVPQDFQKHIKIESHFMCSRCFNLIETVENLELKLKSTKQFLTETLSNTISVTNVRKSSETNISSVEELKDDWFDPQSSEMKNKENQKIVETYQNIDLEPEPDPEPESKLIVVVPKIAPDGPQVSKLIALKNTDEPNVVRNNDTHGCEIKSDLSMLSTEDSKSNHNFSCEDCEQKFECLVTLSEHKKTHPIKVSVVCSECGKAFKSKSKLNQHILVHTGLFKHLCDICGKKFRQKHHFEDHVLKHSGKFKFHCKICRKGFMQKSTLRIHSSMHSPERGNPQVCQNCGKNFSNKWNLAAHLSLCNNELNFVCDLCAKKFNSKQKLLDHVQSVHEHNYKYRCHSCEKGFMKKSSLDAHMIVHSKLKSFVCHKCGKSYKTLSNLNQHSKSHSTDAQFKCTLCDAKFLRKSNLEAHLNNHKGHRPYKCSDCDKIFASEHYLKIHRKQHNGQKKSVPCLNCSKVIKNGLKIHTCIHSGAKRFLCSLCDTAFISKTALRKHMDSKHES